VALANAPSKAVADQCPVVKTRKRNRRRVLTWFASRWRNHQPKRAEKPHSKFNFARGWTALPRGRRLRLPRRMASGSRQPPQGERQMSARERELGELPSPDLSPLGRKAGRGLFVLSQPACPAVGLTWQRAMRPMVLQLLLGVSSFSIPSGDQPDNRSAFGLPRCCILSRQKDLPSFWFPAKTPSTLNSNHF
jgi:hypothetical protein